MSEPEPFECSECGLKWKDGRTVCEHRIMPHEGADVVDLPEMEQE